MDKLKTLKERQVRRVNKNLEQRVIDKKKEALLEKDIQTRRKTTANQCCCSLCGTYKDSYKDAPDANFCPNCGKAFV